MQRRRRAVVCLINLSKRFLCFFFVTKGIGRARGIGAFPGKRRVCAQAFENEIVFASISTVKVCTKKGQKVGA